MEIDKIMLSGCMLEYVSTTDEEEKRIMRRLYYVYGIKPTGNKTIDKEKLHQCEIKQFHAEKIVSGKYLTISKNEQEKYLQKEKEKKIDTVQNNPDELKRLGATTKGEQVYQALQMKKHLDKVTEQKRKDKLKEQEKKKEVTIS